MGLVVSSSGGGAAGGGVPNRVRLLVSAPKCPAVPRESLGSLGIDMVR